MNSYNVKKAIKKIGVFDSGVGGLSVLKELLTLPIPEFIYYADTANLPYGEKTPEQIIQFSVQAFDFLSAQNVDAIVVACHTASAVALEQLRNRYTIPIIGVVDSVVQATLQHSRNHTIGVIGTTATINSQIHAQKIIGKKPQAQVISQACPRLVPLIEQGLVNKNGLYAALEEYLYPIKNAGCDSLIIGCTHYELIKDALSLVAGPDIQLMSAPAHVKQTLQLFVENGENQHNNVVTYYVTGNQLQFQQNAHTLLNLRITNQQIRFPIN